jgi:hypothetical protein
MTHEILKMDIESIRQLFEARVLDMKEQLEQLEVLEDLIDGDMLYAKQVDFKTFKEKKVELTSYQLDLLQRGMFFVREDLETRMGTFEEALAELKESNTLDSEVDKTKPVAVVEEDTEDELEEEDDFDEEDEDEDDDFDSDAYDSEGYDGYDDDDDDGEWYERPDSNSY